MPTSRFTTQDMGGCCFRTFCPCFARCFTAPEEVDGAASSNTESANNVFEIRGENIMSHTVQTEVVTQRVFLESWHNDCLPLHNDYGIS